MSSLLCVVKKAALESPTSLPHSLQAMAACEVAWLQKLLADLGQSVNDAVVIM